MINFEISGRRVKPENIADTLESSMLKSIAGQIRKKIGSIRDPQTGEFPTGVMRGDSLDNLSMHVEGSPAIIKAVRSRLEDDEIREKQIDAGDTAIPKVFLSYAHENMELARNVAQTLQSKGIDTWWDQWCIKAGDSLRQKIDEGLGECTHFLVLLTRESINKPWVNQEMDAGLVLRHNSKCRFLPIRYQLPVSELPLSLSGIHAPEIDDDDFSQLVADIHGDTRKPPIGSKPESIAATDEFADPKISSDDIAKQTGLSLDKVTKRRVARMALDNEKLAHILSLHAAGLKQKAIAKLVGCSQPEVSTTIKKYRDDKR